MQTPEEAAREVGRSFGLWLVEQDGLDAAAEIIRARDAEIIRAHVVHLTADNARLREGIEALCFRWRGSTNPALHMERALSALLNPPTEGESDGTA